MELGRDKTGLMWHQTTEADQRVAFGEDPIIGIIDHARVHWDSGNITPTTFIELAAKPSEDEAAQIIYHKEIKHGFMDVDLGYVKTPFFGLKVALAQRRARKIAKHFLPAGHPAEQPQRSTANAATIN